MKGFQKPRLKCVFTFFTRVHPCLLLWKFLFCLKHFSSVSVVASSLGLRDTAPFNWLICKMLLCSFLPFCFIHFIHHFSCLLLATITASVQVSMQIKFETLANVMFRIVHLIKNKGRQHSWNVLLNGNSHVLPKTCFRTLLQNEFNSDVHVAHFSKRRTSVYGVTRPLFYPIRNQYSRNLQQPNLLLDRFAHGR